MPPLPDPHALATMALTVFALLLFMRDRIPLETSALVVITLLVLGFHLFPYAGDGRSVTPSDFVTQFGNEALITICALLIMGRGIESTGAMRPAVAALGRAWEKHPALALLGTMVLAAVLSAFVNNTPIVVMLLPMLVTVAMRTKTPPSAILMPVGLATLLGGMSTTIGTSTNLLVVSLAEELGVVRFGLFDFTAIAAMAAVLGLAFLWLVAPRLLPSRSPPLADTAPRVFRAVLTLDEDAWAAGRTLAEALARTGKRMRVDRIQRGENLFLAKLPSARLGAGDRLYVRDTPDRLKEFERLLGATLYDVEGQPIGAGQTPAANQRLAEIVVTRGSPLRRSTLAANRFAARFGLLPLALHRAREPGRDETADVASAELRAGDIILVQGEPEALETLKRSGFALVLDGTLDLPETRRAAHAVAIMAGVVVAAALGLVPISAAAVTGAALMLFTRCLSWREAGRALSMPVVFVIVASLGLGLALTRTGGAQYLAELFVHATEGLPASLLVAGMVFLMGVLTNFVSNNAAAVIGTPIAVSVAEQVGVAPEAFVLAVLFGANMSYATPIGYQTNLLVLAAGGYRFSDFVRVGLPLTLLMGVSFSVLLTWVYGL